MAGIVCGGTGALGQGQSFVNGALTPNVPYQNMAGNSAIAAGPSPSQIASATQTQVLYSAASPTTGTTAAGTPYGPGIYPYIRCVSAGGLVNTGTVVDVVFPNGITDVQSIYAVVYTIAGGLLT